MRSVSALSRLLDAAPVGMLVATASGEIVYANRAFGDLLDLQPSTQAPLALFDLVVKSQRLAFRLQFERLVRRETTTYRGEHRFCHNDGQPLWVMVAASSLPGEAGEPDLVILQLTSIELQKKAEEALAYSESRWNFALESARQGVWDHDIRRDTMFYSRMWRVMRGIPPEEEVDGDQELWLARVHPDDRAHVLGNVHRQDRGDETFEALQYRELTRDGRYIWILSRGRPVEWDDAGNPTRTIGTDTDITHIKTMELELAAEKERLRVTLEAMADGMISTDLDGEVIFMNPAAESLVGMSASQAIGRPVDAVFHLRSESQGDLPSPVRQCLELGTVVRVDDDTILVGHDGQQRDIRCSASPFTTEGGAIAGAVLVFQDVTQSRALQRQLAHSASHDELTGLPNRAAFERALGAAIASARDSRRSHCLVYLDLDHFKPVNDSAGHAAGDELLRQVGSTIRDTLRNHDVAARIGGDEFALILEDCSVANAVLVAGKVVRAIAALSFTWAGRQYRIGASAGVTPVGQDPASPLGFMGEADAACYAAKAEGRGRVIAFPDMVSRSKR